MDAQAKKTQLVSQLMDYYEQDAKRLTKLGNGLRMLGIDTNNGEHLDNIAKYPEHFLTLISYSDLGLLSKLDESVKVIKGTT